MIMKPIPTAKAKSLKSFLSKVMFLKYPLEEVSSSDVTSRIMAVTASHRLMSDKERGKGILSPLHYTA